MTKLNSIDATKNIVHGLLAVGQFPVGQFAVKKKLMLG